VGGRGLPEIARSFMRVSPVTPLPLSFTVRQPVAKIKESLNRRFGFVVEFGKAKSFLMTVFFCKSFALFHCVESDFQLMSWRDFVTAHFIGFYVKESASAMSGLVINQRVF